MGVVSTRESRDRHGQLAQLGRAVHVVSIGNLSWYCLKVSCTGRGVQIPHCPQAFYCLIYNSVVKDNVRWESSFKFLFCFCFKWLSWCGLTAYPGATLLTCLPSLWRYGRQIWAFGVMANTTHLRRLAVRVRQRPQSKRGLFSSFVVFYFVFVLWISLVERQGLFFVYYIQNLCCQFSVFFIRWVGNSFFLLIVNWRYHVCNNLFQL